MPKNLPDHCLGYETTQLVQDGQGIRIKVVATFFIVFRVLLIIKK